MGRVSRIVSIALLLGLTGLAGYVVWPRLQGFLPSGSGSVVAGPRVAPGEWRPEVPEAAAPDEKRPGPLRANRGGPGGFRFHVDVPGWAAAAYGDAAPERPLDRRAAETVAAQGRVDLRYDRALARAAQSLAEIEAGSDVPLTGGLTDFVLNRAGVVAPAVRRFLYFSSQRDEAGFLEHVAAVLGRDEPDGSDRLVGVGHAEGSRDPRFRHTFIILLATPRVSLESLPRSAAPGATLVVDGRLLGGLREPRVLYLLPGGAVETVPVETRGRSGFRGMLTLPEAPGEMWLEVLGDGDRGPEVAALFPVHVGQPAPDRYDGVAPPEEGAMGSPEALSNLLFELVNLDRARFGLPPLERDPALDRVAERHALDMRDNDFVAHVSPQSGSVADRARAARYAHLALGENVARDESVYSAQEALMRSLGHRENILNARFTHLGVGVAIEERLSGGRALSIVQNFAVPARREDPAQVAARIRDQINRVRVARGHSPLERQSGLEQAARAALSDLWTPDSVAAAARKALEDDRPAVGDIAIRSYVLPDLAAFELPEAALDPDVRWVGVAAAQADQLDEDPRLWLVVLTAD